MSFRNLIKTFGKDVRLNARAVRACTHKLSLALLLLKIANIHADINPNNIFVHSIFEQANCLHRY